MKNLIIAALFLVSGSASAQWYVGGTLHGQNLGEWRTATHANKEATLADIVGKLTKSTDPNEVRPKVRQVEPCVDKVAAEKSMRLMSVSQTAVDCMLELGYISLGAGRR